MSFDLLPDELISSILIHLPSKELARLSSVNSVWLDSARLIYKSRIAEAFGQVSGQFRYVFEASQPIERLQGTVLQLRQRKIVLDGSDVDQDYTIFDFPPSSAGSSRYSFSLEPESFIQLCILGNIIQTRAGGGLEGVVLHLEDFCRIKDENLGTQIGTKHRFRINDNAHLITTLMKREQYSEAGKTIEDDSPVKYDIEFHSLEVKSASLLKTLEEYQANSLTSTALVLRSAT